MAAFLSSHFGLELFGVGPRRGGGAFLDPEKHRPDELRLSSLGFGRVSRFGFRGEFPFEEVLCTKPPYRIRPPSHA